MRFFTTRGLYAIALIGAFVSTLAVLIDCWL
jgi:hypothetical protein